MPKVILKMPYIKGGGSRNPHLSTLVKYIATRDGVKVINKNAFDLPTNNQIELIQKIIKEFPNTKTLFEYQDYNLDPSFENASDFITIALEHNFDKAAKKDNYVKYIANRPNAKAINTHGLFTSGNEKINLTEVAKELANHQGNVWTPIISLRREDAIETGYDNPERWKNMLESFIPTIAENLKIPISKFKWYASFHDESHHPHVHLICYSTDSRYGYLNKNGLSNLRSGLTREIFKERLFEVYQMQTQTRDTLKKEAEKVFRNLNERIENTEFTSPRFEELVTTLNKKLQNTSGKKQYGYLKNPVKIIINEIVDELAKHPVIKDTYKVWCDMQQEVYSSYSNVPPKTLPLSQQKEFKSIKNMIIKETMKLEIGDIEIENLIIIPELTENKIQKQKDKPTNESISKSALNLLKSLASIIEDKVVNDATTLSDTMDSKKLRKLMEQELSKGKNFEVPKEENIKQRFN